MAKHELSLVKYARAIKDSPREIFNRNLFLTTICFALTGSSKGWDEGSAAAITHLESFDQTYNVDDTVTSNVVSLVNIGCGVGALLSFLINDRIGRVWSMRIYQTICIIGSLISCLSYGNIGALYTGRIIGGLGIGALTVIGPMAIAEIAPKSTRGLMILWFSACMLSGQVIGVFAVYGSSIHISPSGHLQYQVPWFVQTFVPAITILLSFFIVESPRWLMQNRRDECLATLSRLRGLSPSHPYLEAEYGEMIGSIESEELATNTMSSMKIVKETFLIPANLRRVQLTIICYILAQMSGANSITNYLPTIFGLIGVMGSDEKIYATGLYSMTKLICCIIASLFLVEVIGRRNSLLVGISIQIICDSYLAGYLNFYYENPNSVSSGASRAAVGFIFIHAFGWSIGLYSLPYLFGAELWPNRIRSFGGALSQCFHWLFFFAITEATPSLLTSLHEWGAFIFFVGFCFLAILYTFFFVPETRGLSLEQINLIFERPLWCLRQPLDLQTGRELHETTLAELEDDKGTRNHIENI